MSSYGQIGIEHQSVKSTYIVSSAFSVPASATTDFWQLAGSSSKTIKIEKIEVAYQSNDTGSLSTQAFLIVRSVANTLGAGPVTLTAVPTDSNSSAGSAVSKISAANPSSLGTAVGQVWAGSIMSSSSNTDYNINPNATTVIYQAPLVGEPLTLRGTAQSVCLNFNGVIPRGTSPVLAVTCTYTEE